MKEPLEGLRGDRSLHASASKARMQLVAVVWLTATVILYDERQRLLYSLVRRVPATACSHSRRRRVTSPACERRESITRFSRVPQ